MTFEDIKEQVSSSSSSNLDSSFLPASHQRVLSPRPHAPSGRLTVPLVAALSLNTSHCIQSFIVPSHSAASEIYRYSSAGWMRKHGRRISSSHHCNSRVYHQHLRVPPSIQYPGSDHSLHSVCVHWKHSQGLLLHSRAPFVICFRPAKRLTSRQASSLRVRDFSVAMSSAGIAPDVGLLLAITTTEVTNLTRDGLERRFAALQNHLQRMLAPDSSVHRGHTSSQHDHAPVPASRLLSLPPELRLIILEYVAEPRDCPEAGTWQHCGYAIHRSPLKYPDILRVCRQIYHDVESVRHGHYNHAHKRWQQVSLWFRPHGNFMISDEILSGPSTCTFTST